MAAARASRAESLMGRLEKRSLYSSPFFKRREPLGNAASVSYHSTGCSHPLQSSSPQCISCWRFCRLPHVRFSAALGDLRY